MEAIIFDIDGTLVESEEADASLYIMAVKEVMGDVQFREEWDDYPDVTDTGILKTLFDDNEIEPEDEIVAAIHDHFVILLEEHIQQVAPFSPIHGAVDFVDDLQQSPDHQIAFATGGWRASALLKLHSAGFATDQLVLASANDHHERVQIMLQALRHLGEHFDQVTYYGDGHWDERATESLGWQFMPVGPKLGGLTEYVIE